ncbi:MAG: ATP-grasp domain-containing protein [Planctomycetales bacterium]
MTTLLLSSRHTPDNQALWRVAVQSGWDVERVRGLTVPAGLEETELVIYLEPLIAREISGQLGLTLIEAPEDWLVRLHAKYRRRDIEMTSLGAARRLGSPRFLKSPNDKTFAAQVYRTGADLPAEEPDDMPLLLAEPVAFEVEYRCFVHERAVRTISPYVRFGELASQSGFVAPESEQAEALGFANLLLADERVEVPVAIVLDVGRIEGRGWAAVELNGAWGAGIYGCDPCAVLEVIRNAITRNA